MNYSAGGLHPEGGAPEAVAGFGWGVAKLVKAPDFDSGMRRFESFLPSHLISATARRGV